VGYAVRIDRWRRLVGVEDENAAVTWAAYIDGSVLVVERGQDLTPGMEAEVKRLGAELDIRSLVLGRHQSELLGDGNVQSMSSAAPDRSAARSGPRRFRAGRDEAVTSASSHRFSDCARRIAGADPVAGRHAVRLLDGLGRISERLPGRQLGDKA
jgi:hypothetical protein